MTKAVTPPPPNCAYTACQSTRVAKPAVQQMIAASESMPSPTAPK
ncbi:hypothetical protein QFW80_15310 [Luteimonas sp. M1R5S18]|uniref:Uncharacterized protein n=1 Tax=Luteimonas rhizosphaericola TaxID=3042024 RepID=A0ABT6JMH5_9GAMM|nr:hypothetical protein [Luteimonas rhizosphaericola]MDH5831889.1 hypothetical protein [Luteimonas rhizosphaericola]